MLKKLPTMYTTDNTSEKLYWVVEGTKPIHKQQLQDSDLDQEIINLKQEIIDQDKEIIDIKKQNIDKEQKIIDQEKEIKALRQQIIVLKKGQPGQN